ncbi:isochorismatase family protein [Priestia megaterium]|uniref:isochorismatase family protein n=1 Tax=Priestia megaterium TaxID=1404 RepID=UPI00159C995D|nr:isochorismatase family protein [Priestia megaterium]
MSTLSLEKTALVVIDLQKGVVSVPCEPYSAQTVVENAEKLIAEFEKKGAFVTLVYVPRPDEGSLNPALDNTEEVEFPSDWDEFVHPIKKYDNHYIIKKRQWGAFHGTDLDLQLRRRGIDTIVMCGVSTAYGVDTTAREAFQHGYNQIFAIDAMSAYKEEEHEYVKTNIFPKIGKIRSTDEVLDMIGE